MHNVKCFNAHTGLYCIEPDWMSRALKAIQAGLWPIRAYDDDEGEKTPDENSIMQVVGNIGLIPMHGAMHKGWSKFGGVDTVQTRRMIRAALAEPSIAALVLHIDSPGGTVSGTKELADEVLAAKKKKPIWAYVEDLGASAAYWVASQTDRIVANEMAEVGSIGTVAVVDDFSGKAEMNGVKVHVISTGPYKGAFVQGAPVPEHHLADLRRRVEAMNQFFQTAVSTGRGLNGSALEQVSDGRVFIASEAMGMSLIDGIGTIQSVVEQLSATIPSQAPAASSGKRRTAAQAKIEIAKLR